MKIFFAVNVETKKALAMLVTTDGTHDSRAFPEDGLIRKDLLFLADETLGNKTCVNLEKITRRTTELPANGEDDQNALFLKC